MGTQRQLRVTKLRRALSVSGRTLLTRTTAMKGAKERVHVGPVSSFTFANNRQLVKCGTRNIAVICHQSKFYAIDNACYHHGGPLLQGDIEDIGGSPCIVCPWHSYKITLDTGEGLYMGIKLDPHGGRPQVEVKSKGCKQRVHRVEVEDGEVYVVPNLDESRLESDAYANMVLANQETAMIAPVTGGQSAEHRLHSGFHHRKSPSEAGKLDLDVGVAEVLRHRKPHLSRESHNLSGGTPCTLQVRCVAVHDVCDDVKEFIFTRHAGTANRLYRPGEYVEVELPVLNEHGHPLRRKWTICEVYENGTQFSLLVKLKPNNPKGGSAWLFQRGLYEPIQVVSIAGQFTIPDHASRIRKCHGRVLWLTAGIGITSAYATLKSVYDGIAVEWGSDASLHVVHLHVDRTVSSVAKLDVFLEWCRGSSGAATTSSRRYAFQAFLTHQRTPVLSDSTESPSVFVYGRRVQAEDIMAAVRAAFQTFSFVVFVCGPPGFISACTDTLISCGIDERDVLTDDP